MDMVDELMLLNEDEIEYESLSDEVLAKLSLGDEIYMATSALSELGIRKSPKAVKVSWDILTKELGDSFLQSIALRNIFAFDQKEAIEYFKKIVSDCDFILLEAIMEIMIENPAEFKNELQENLVPEVRARIAKLSKARDGSNAELPAAFMATFDT